MDETLLDTDILSEVLKRRNPRVLANTQQYLQQYGRLSFSAISFYEVLQGLLSTGATTQLTTFLRVANTSEVVPVSLNVLRGAADLWAEGQRGGFPCADADLPIAATALESRRVLATGNTSHFSWIPGLTIADWRAL
ncbi:MAG: type II toxin-antitoxin system VapC family toxin [Planctomycetaceae bacterium]